ncbi:MAG: TolC family protein [Opitutales bacterium]|nr:TolC family protein [Opitutales bacterium]
MNKRFSPIALSFLYSAFAATAASLPSTAGPEDLVAYALEHNASLAAAGARTEAGRERVPQARALPNPELMYSHYIQRMDVRQSIGVRQAFPYPGTLARRASVAEREAEVRAMDAASLRRVLADEIIRTYANLAYIDATLRILGDNISILERIEQSVEARIEAGDGSGAALIRAEIARARLEDERAALEARIPPLRARMNRFLGRAPHEGLPSLKPLEAAVAETSARNDGPGGLAAHPDLEGLERAIEGRREAVELARREGRPGFALGAEWMDTVSGKREEVMVTLGISLPLWRERYRAGEREARAERRALEAERRDRRYRLEAEFREAADLHEDALRRAALYGDRLLPRGRQALEAEEAAYAGGRGDLLDVLDAQRVLLELQQAHDAALADILRSRATLIRLLGDS